MIWEWGELCEWEEGELAQLRCPETPNPGHVGLDCVTFSPFDFFFKTVGADLLKLTREDVIQICGPADGIRLFNALKGRYVVCLKADRGW